MKALSYMVQTDPSILFSKPIEEAVTGRLLDASIVVREAAVDLIGKYIHQSACFSEAYYHALLLRLKDKGPSVRKRVVKCLRNIIVEDLDNERIVEILGELIKRCEDDNDTIRTCVVKTFVHIWVDKGSESSTFKNICRVLKVYPMKDSFVALLKSMIKYEGKTINRLTQVATSAVNQLYASKTTINSLVYAKLLEILALTEPQIVKTHISTLHIFLTPNDNTPEESEVLICIANMIEKAACTLKGKKTKNVSKIERNLLNLVYTQGTALVSAAVGALCSICQHITYDANTLIQLIRNCFVILSSQKRPEGIDSKMISSLYRALLVISLTIKNFSKDIYSIIELETGKTFSESIFDFIKYYCSVDNTTIKYRALESLSAIWIRFPYLLASSEVLVREAWKEAESCEAKLTILRMFNEFLMYADIEPIEDTDTSPIFLSIQGYVDYILYLAKDSELVVRESAVRVVKLIHQQGLVNPTLYLSILIACLSDENLFIRETCYLCIEKLYKKSSNTILVSLKQGIQESYSYQVKLYKTTRNIFESGDSVYNRLYLLLKQKKAQKFQFLNTLVGLLEPSADPSFTYFISELISTLNFSISSEISTIFNHITSKLDSTGQRTLRTISTCKKNKEGLRHIDLMDALLTLQLIILKKYLEALYHVKDEDNHPDRPVQRISDEGTKFCDLYEGFYEYHTLQELSVSMAVDFKEKVFSI